MNHAAPQASHMIISNKKIRILHPDKSETCCNCKKATISSCLLQKQQIRGDYYDLLRPPSRFDKIQPACVPWYISYTGGLHTHLVSLQSILFFSSSQLSFNSFSVSSAASTKSWECGWFLSIQSVGKVEDGLRGSFILPCLHRMYLEGFPSNCGRINKRLRSNQPFTVLPGHLYFYVH